MPSHETPTKEENPRKKKMSKTAKYMTVSGPLHYDQDSATCLTCGLRLAPPVLSDGTPLETLEGPAWLVLQNLKTMWKLACEDHTVAAWVATYFVRARDGKIEGWWTADKKERNEAPPHGFQKSWTALRRPSSRSHPALPVTDFVWPPPGRPTFSVSAGLEVGPRARGDGCLQ